VSRTVVVAGGGTGGHIFPGLAVARELQAVGARAHWLGARRGLEAELVGQRGVPLTLVELEGFHGRGAAAVLRALGLMPHAVAASIRALLRIEPARARVGSYALGRRLMAAGLLGVPYVLQEQNSVPGLTNRFLAPWSALVCCGFADAVHAFPSLPAEWTGNPVRESFFAVPPVEAATPPRLLILGGSQGSLFLNRTLPRAIAILRQRGSAPKVRHQAGVRWADVVRTSYQDLSIDARWRRSCQSRGRRWPSRPGGRSVRSAHRLRAGGGGTRRAADPFAAAAGGRQLYNARSLETAGGAVVLTEDEASPERVAAMLQQLLTEPDRLRVMGARARAVSLPGAARRIAERVLAVGRGQ
jgi:UDP-N-acetylglucosamine--N-acetylmuramyl-(pentapeptide) pyrophosphoryl-undecaprenol N-acetylglucosamine transferase